MRKFRLLLLLLPFITLNSQNIDMEQISADEEFRLGVVAFHQGFFNKAIHSLERSLVFKPETVLVRQWLGRAYYQSGYEDAALNEWDNLIEAGNADSALMAFRDIVHQRRGLMDELKQRDSWIELLNIETDRSGTPFLGRPTSVSPTTDGRGFFYSVSFASNLISQFDPNGDQVAQFNGGIDGFNRPFDILLLDNDRFLVSEFDGDRISLCDENGYRLITIGSRGRKEGQLLGPQFLARSGQYFYVSDWGNKEVDKFSLDGEFILSFGDPQSEFPGFTGPSGITLTPAGLAVADYLEARVYLFDESGNYLRTLIDRGLNGPEGLTMGKEGNLFIADGDRILEYDFKRESIETVFQSEVEDSRILKVGFDENSNMLIPDFNHNRISLMTELSTLYGGLFLRIDRVDSRNYPEILVDVTLEDPYGRPYVGLDKGNFLVKEREQYLSDIELVSAGYMEKSVDLQLMIEDSKELKNLYERVRFTLTDLIARKKAGDQYRMLSASNTPYLLAEDGENPFLALEEEWAVQPSSPDWQFDTSLRLAASELIHSRERRIIVFFSSGELPEQAFSTYGLVELGSYLKNNNIQFYPVYFERTGESEELNYLARQSGGETFHSLDPQGVGRLLDRRRNSNQGNYTFRFESESRIDFGREYIPLEIEVNYLRKSGRDELGYFAPIDFEPTRR